MNVIAEISSTTVYNKQQTDGILLIAQPGHVGVTMSISNYTNAVITTDCFALLIEIDGFYSCAPYACYRFKVMQECTQSSKNIANGYKLACPFDSARVRSCCSNKDDIAYSCTKNNCLLSVVVLPLKRALPFHTIDSQTRFVCCT